MHKIYSNIVPFNMKALSMHWFCHPQGLWVQSSRDSGDNHLWMRMVCSLENLTNQCTGASGRLSFGAVRFYQQETPNFSWWLQVFIQWLKGQSRKSPLSSRLPEPAMRLQGLDKSVNFLGLISSAVTQQLRLPGSGGALFIKKARDTTMQHWCAYLFHPTYSHSSELVITIKLIQEMGKLRPRETQLLDSGYTGSWRQDRSRAARLGPSASCLCWTLETAEAQITATVTHVSVLCHHAALQGVASKSSRTTE